MKQLLLILFIFLGGVTGFTQRTLYGTVTDNNGEVVIGATLIIEGTRIGTITSIDGEYNLELTENAQVIVVSLKGYSSKKVEIGSSNRLDIRLDKERALSNENTFTDSRDNQSYKFKTFSKDIGFGVIVTQTWMIENLRFNTGSGSVYHQSVKSNDRNKYGLLYTWQAAQQACPKGWHLPSDVEWQQFIHLFIEGGLGPTANSSEAYSILVEGGTSGFSASLGSYRAGPTSSGFGPFNGSSGFYWTSSQGYNGNQFGTFYLFEKKKLERKSFMKGDAMSCRCMKD